MPSKVDLEIQIESLKEQIKRLQESEHKLEKELYRAKNIPQISRNNIILTEENKKLTELLKISNIIND
jgi:cell shape-determining protein MreC